MAYKQQNWKLKEGKQSLRLSQAWRKFGVGLSIDEQDRKKQDAERR